LVNSPDVARAFNGIGGYIASRKQKLDPRLRELAILQVGWMEKSNTNSPIREDRQGSSRHRRRHQAMMARPGQTVHARAAGEAMCAAREDGAGACDVGCDLRRIKQELSMST
jgi:hypothetical protein